MNLYAWKADRVFSQIYPESFRNTSEGDSHRMSDNTLSALLDDAMNNRAH
jgi:hypothetical protein